MTIQNLNCKNKHIQKIHLNICYDCIINYIPKPIRKILGGFKNKV